MTVKLIKEFSVFVQLVKAGKMTDAARVLGMSPATISQRLRHLEQELGVRLVNRNARAMKVTDEGRALFERLDSLMGDLEDTAEAVVQLAKGPHGTLRVWSTMGLGRNRIAVLVKEFIARFPEVPVQLFLGDRPYDFVSEGLDVAIAIGQPEDSSLVARKLMDNRCHLIASPQYLATHPALKTPEDLRDHECLILDCHASFKDFWPLYDDQGDRHAVKVHGRLHTDHSEVLLQWAVDGMGIALKSAWDIQPYLDDGRLVEVLPNYRPPDLDFYLVYPERKCLPAKTRVFMDFLFEKVPAGKGEH
ncbi:LysR family transcriptional regulator [Alcanivorax sp. VBW004]|uniref:LysR family transcriptional regulator n=1 Tax=Alcanivorax sp. VBW004 TaxID=1287708 RepID=UPI0012BB9A10|nr:LysR family transcriptional regulator [Alcanivorax sp. VBW004]MTT53053.1 LysR family transcriptional regulator [Alcanivorax sp. VBW004]